MERFNLIFKGETCAPLTPETMGPVLTSLGFSQAHIDRVSAGRSLTVKRDLLFARAQQIKLALEMRGLVTELTVVLNPENLAAGLRYTNQPQQAFSTLEVIHPKLVQPSLIVPKGDYKVQQRRHHSTSQAANRSTIQATQPTSTCVTHLGTITQSHMRFTSAGRLFLGLLFALPLQTHVLRVLPNYIESATTATLLGIICFFLMILIFPVLLRPLTLRSVHVRTGDNDIHILDTWQWHLNQNRFLILNYRLESLGDIYVKRNSVKFHAASGQVRFQWDAFAKIQAVEGTLSILTDKVFDGTAIGDMNEYWANFQKIFFFLRPTPTFDRVKFKDKHGHVVTDGHGEVAAIIYKNNESVGISIHENFKEDAQILRAMAVVFTDGPLML